MIDLTSLTGTDLAEQMALLEAEDAAADARLSAPDALARAARWYASQGIAVFPLWPGQKNPQIAKAHPDDQKLQDECQGACGRDGHGLHDATTDLERVAGWWARWPQANIGLRTGLLVDVIDLDGAKGIRSWADSVRHAGCAKRPDGTPACCDDLTRPRCEGDGVTELAVLGGRPPVGIVRTAGTNGGLHYYVCPTGEANGANLLPGVDYRGDGGYVVAPPSRGKLGIYRWAEPINIAALSAAAA